METTFRKPNSVKRFNKYVNKVIEVYHETGEFKGVELGTEYKCSRISELHFKKMGLASLDRPLTVEETEKIYQYRRNPSEASMPCFSDSVEYETPSATLFDDIVEDVKEEEEETTTESPNLITNIITKAKNTITTLFKRKNANGFYVQGRQDGDTTTFVWNNDKKKIDFVLVLRKNKVVECRRVEEDEEISSQVFDKVDVKQVFRAVSFMKYEYDKLQKENEILRTKINAVAQVLLIEDEKHEPSDE